MFDLEAECERKPRDEAFVHTLQQDQFLRAFCALTSTSTVEKVFLSAFDCQFACGPFKPFTMDRVFDSMEEYLRTLHNVDQDRVIPLPPPLSYGPEELVEQVLKCEVEGFLCVKVRRLR